MINMQQAMNRPMKYLHQIRVWFKYILLYIRIQIFVVYVSEMKTTKGHVFVFGLYLKSICKYNQIHITITKKGKALPDINWLRRDRMSFKPVVWSTVGRQHRENRPTVKLVKL